MALTLANGFSSSTFGCRMDKMDSTAADIDRFLEDDSCDFDSSSSAAASPIQLEEEDTFAMNLLNNENMTWTVERERGMSFDHTRERGMSFDLSALCVDPEAHNSCINTNRHDAISQAESNKREIKQESEASEVNDFPFGHPGQPVLQHNHSRDRAPSVHFGPPSPILRPTSSTTMPGKRLYPEPSLVTREKSGSMVKRQRGQNGQALSNGGSITLRIPPPAAPAPARAHTRSRSVGYRAPVRTRSESPPRRPTPSILKANAGTSKMKSEGGGPTSRRNKSSAAKSGGVDTSALLAELGLVDSRQRSGGRRGGKGSTVHRVGAYTLEERAILVAKFHAKRGRRIWRKKIKYDCRKKLADKRPRLKGRFVTQEELDGLDAETLAKVTGLGPHSDVESSTEDAEDSDSSEGSSSSVSANSRCRGVAGPSVAKTGASPSTCGMDIASERGRAEKQEPRRASCAKGSSAKVGLVKKVKTAVVRAKGKVLTGATALNITRSTVKSGAYAGVKGGGKGAGKTGTSKTLAKTPKSRPVKTKSEPREEEQGDIVHVEVVETRSRRASVGGMSDAGFDVMDVFADVEACEDGDTGPGVEVGLEEGVAGAAREDVSYAGGDHLVAGFMVDDILSNTFDLMSASVTVK